MKTTSTDYMLQIGHNYVGYHRKDMLSPYLGIFMETVTDGTRTDFVQFTVIKYIHIIHLISKSSKVGSLFHFLTSSGLTPSLPNVKMTLVVPCFKL